MDGLERFLSAQDGVYSTALAELRAGRKRTHWMWFIFPQLSGLGRSSTAEGYALTSLDEARAYCDHPVLYDRLIKCCSFLFAHRDQSASAIMGSPDDLKLHSSMTLFALAQPENPTFKRMLEVFFESAYDAQIEALLSK